MTKRILRPKDLVNAFKDYENVTLRHLKTRLDKQFFIPFEASTGQGTKTLYDLESALQYGASIILENMGVNIKDSAYIAFLLINFFFNPYEKNLWAITIGENVKNYRTFIHNECGSKYISESVKKHIVDEEKFKDSFIYIEPWEKILFRLRKDDTNMMEKSLNDKISFLRFLNISNVTEECCLRFNLTEDEIEDISRQAKNNEYKPSEKIQKLWQRYLN